MATENAIGVCSWCLGTDDVPGMFAAARDVLGANVVQVGLFGAAAVSAADPGAIRAAADAKGVALSASFVLFDDEDYSSIAAVRGSGGFVPAEPFETRLALLHRVAEITRALGLHRLSIHGGAVPESPDHPLFAALVQRFQAAADRLQALDVRLLLETGQESAAALVRLVEAVGRVNVGVNFDSGNFIMYGTDDPVAAARTLAPRVEHVHLKDARRSDAPGETWGTEVALGAGDADIPAVVSVLRTAGYSGPFVVERSRRRSLEEVAESVAYLRNLLQD